MKSVQRNSHWLQWQPYINKTFTDYVLIIRFKCCSSTFRTRIFRKINPVVNEAIDWMVQMFFWWLNSFLPRSPDSENTATTVTALLASLNSCCNPWIYMFFSGHLLQDCIQSFPCCQQIKQTLSKEDSNSNSRRQTSFTNNRSPTHSLNTWREMSHSKVTSFIPIPTWDTQDLQSHHSVWEGCGMVLYASPGHHGTKEWLRWSWDKKCHLAW